MFSKISVRGGALRAYGGVARRPTGVMGVQSQLRCLSLAAAPIQARPQLQELQKLRPITQSSTFATKATKEPKEPKEPKARTPKAATAKGENAQKAQKPITKTQKIIQARQHMKDLKATALQPPARLPSTARHLCLSSIMNELNKVSGSRSERLKAAHVKYSELTSSELEQYKAQAAENKIASEAAYQSFIESYTPQQILEANKARSELSNLTKGNWQPLKDHRRPKAPVSPFFIYFAEQRASAGPAAGTTQADFAKAVAAEYKSLPAWKKEVGPPRDT
ncbi:unnamed protein product [Penicillium olsonii]|nr:unnamed protein product [Penicillium olsonii]CAG7923488.1 unnamed protein product [Penicillium olsonii]